MKNSLLHPQNVSVAFDHMSNLPYAGTVTGSGGEMGEGEGCVRPR